MSLFCVIRILIWLHKKMSYFLELQACEMTLYLEFVDILARKHVSEASMTDFSKLLSNDSYLYIMVHCFSPLLYASEIYNQ